MLTLSPATKRALRTLYQGVLALITLVPALVVALPEGSPLAVKLGAVVAAVAAVSGVLNKLEDAGLIPAWLKDE